jgi:hypothetical protein
MLKERIAGFMGGIVLAKMSKKSRSTYVQKPVPVEIWAMFMCSLQQTLFAVLMHFNTTFSSSSHRAAHSVENS